tara:strand:+ start:479 stop:1186 length:708 start_codon:yes stop_codon:yes gene_type:complete
MESINPTWHIDAAKFVKHQIDEDISRMTEEQRIEFFEAVKEHIHERSPLQSQPVNRIRWVDVDDVQANDYNPNSVASQEMHLLYTSILHDGYTQPVVTIYDEAIGKYVIIDGFHRYFTCKNNPDIRERNKGKLPVVVLEKDINDRMASTVRHNRARGKHSIGGMSNMVFSMLDNGWDDADICNHLGMDADELLRLKHITGFSKLFEDAEYNKAWTTKHQLMLKKKQAESAQDDTN